MDPEFQKALLTVLVVGLLVAGAGASGLYVAFRRFGQVKTGEQSHVLLMVATIAFVLMMCFLFFLLARE